MAGKGKAGAAAAEAAGAEQLVVQPGMIVLYVLGADGPGAARRGEIRPAMVVRVWEGQEPPLVQLQVFLDGTNDDPIDGQALSWRTSVRYSAAHEVGTWHWPPAVEEASRAFSAMAALAAAEAGS
jgi:hypothetical protein